MKESLLLIILLIVMTSTCDTISQLCLKASINKLDLNVKGPRQILAFILRIILTPLAWLGFVFSCLSLFLWLFVLSKAELSFAFSLDSMHYVFIAIASGFVLKEKVGLRRWIGTGLIMIGIILVSLTGNG